MIFNLIKAAKDKWLSSADNHVSDLLTYIKKEDNLREAQIEAIETYLFLKIKCENKPLWKLVSEGYFLNDIETMDEVPHKAYNVLSNNKSARALYEIATIPLGKDDKTVLFPKLKDLIIKKTEEVKYETVIKRLFYDVEYNDYLFSLPMGAGKTYLMASFIYLDLYFALNDPDNKLFAHNFIILIPSGLKSSITPSLKSIENFDPTWIIPEPAASKIKQIIKFEVLDQLKTGKRSNKTRNPNSQKVANHQPFNELMGLVLVVNAEKVILDRIKLDDNLSVIEQTQDEIDKQANELRNIIGKIPNLLIMIDEVHHVTSKSSEDYKNEVKLRKVVTRWNKNGVINGVLGFTGTPYLKSSDSIIVDDTLTLRIKEITSTVVYYPLATAITKFLKKPRVEQATGLTSLQIIERGVKDFVKNYEDITYSNGCCAKLAIYCGKIDRLEEEVYPFITGDLGIPPDWILKYHKGNKKHKIPKQAELDFLMLDNPRSKVKIILLVQIGKEGWNCLSLTGIILSQAKDCPMNMVLQTSCRCLRQVDKSNNKETALIWLNNENAQKLDSQLKTEQNSSIEEINKIGQKPHDILIDRFSRMEHLDLPGIDYYQMQLVSDIELNEDTPNPEQNLNKLDANNYLNTVVIQERGLTNTHVLNTSIENKIKGEKAFLDRWLLEICKESFNTVTYDMLKEYENILEPVFKKITFKENDQLYYNEIYKQSDIRSEIRKSFSNKRHINIKVEVIPNQASMLIIEKLSPVLNNEKLYPNENEVNQIIDLDNKNESPEDFEKQIKELISSYSIPLSVLNKDKSFQYLPYNFIQSGYEHLFLQHMLSLNSLKKLGLQVFYNGDRSLTEFNITCYKKRNGSWRKIGKYTPDFLIVERNGNNEIVKVLIIETKGEIFERKKDYALKKKYVESEFLKINKDKFGYQKFEFMEFSDSEDINKSISKLDSKINEFFAENQMEM